MDFNDLCWKGKLIDGLIRDEPGATIKDYFDFLTQLRALHAEALELEKQMQMITKWRPILYKPPMVRGILGGYKDVTRRIIDPQPEFIPGTGWKWTPQRGKYKGQIFVGNERELKEHLAYPAFEFSPYGYNSQDGLWVRETWFPEFMPAPPEGTHDQKIFRYAADWTEREPMTWRPSIHMPKEACRLFQQVVSVRPEKLLEITDAEALREGIKKWELKDTYGDVIETVFKDYLEITDDKTAGKVLYTPIESYRSLWDWINGVGSFKSNPWVWRIEAKVTERPENF